MYNLFYEEPQNDRWFKYDRYPRKIIRRIFRGPEPIGGVKRWFVNLCAGLDIAGIPYTVNNYKALKKNKNEWALVVGKPHVIYKIPEFANIIYGPGVAAHPYENDFLANKSNIKHILISCEWFKKMYERDMPKPIPITVWPSGIELDKWKPNVDKQHFNKILIYDKIRWKHELYDKELLQGIYKHLTEQDVDFEYIKYGSYRESDFQQLLQRVDAMIFLCEHETQGFAYLQTLSYDVPIFAWDRGGYWEDPSMFPEKVKFSEVTSVPYWDARCGYKFKNFKEFEVSFRDFWEKVKLNLYSPRQYIVENFDLANRSKIYIDIVNDIIANEKQK